MRLAALTMYTTATMLLSMLDGTAISVAAFMLCCIGGACIATKQLRGSEPEEAALGEIEIRVHRWNF